MKKRPPDALSLAKEQKVTLSFLGNRLLEDLEVVGNAARGQLGRGSVRPPVESLAAGSNPMVANPAVERIAQIHGVTRSELERLCREPFVARIVLRFDDGETPEQEVFYITRPSAAGIDVIPGARFVTYNAPLGRVSELSVGSQHSVRLGGRSRVAIIQERILLRPDPSSGQWDALDDRFEFATWKVAVESLRRLFKEVDLLGVAEEKEIRDALGELLQKSAEAALLRDRLRRHVINRISLRDQAILDVHQGEIFRLPLDQRLVLLGPPGTGKTTTLIRRLAQKRVSDNLTDDEKAALERAGVGDAIAYPKSWVMFTPTELLKLYLRDAFNDQGVPAAQENLQTWERERTRFGRSILGILRSSERRGFQLDEKASVLKDELNAGVLAFFREFSEHHRLSAVDKVTEAYKRLTGPDSLDSRRDLVRRSFGRMSENDSVSIAMIARQLDGAPAIQEEIRAIGSEIDAESRSLGNRLLRDHPALLTEMAKLGPEFLDEESLEEDEDEDDAEDTEIVERDSREVRPEVAAQLLIAALRRRAAALASGRISVGGRSGRVIRFLGDRLPGEEALRQLGKKILTRSDLRTLARAARWFVMAVPRTYARFRRDAQRKDRFFRAEANDVVRQRRISPNELDVLILTMLRNARTLLRENGWRASGEQDWLQTILSEYKIQVFVDEATDFSLVQLACTLELAHPRLRSWFACGDFNQRITSYGITQESDFQAIADENDHVEIRRIRTGYRQSPKLRELAAALCVDQESAALPNDDIEHDDVWPLLAENCSAKDLPAWLSTRILEVERALGTLPSTAVFVDGEEQINKLVKEVQPLLARENIKIVGCADGRVVGDEQEVRVFDIQHIKGLEFEAVFFVGIDNLASKLDSLFDRYFYVGVSRAATYLGITCESKLPAILENVRKHFQTDNWS